MPVEKKTRGRTRLIVAVVAIFQILGLLSAVHAVMSSRTPQGAIAWAVSLVTFPYVAVPAYWVLGRNKFKGYVLARQEDIDSIRDIAHSARRNVDEVTSDEGPFNPDVKSAEKLARIPLTDGNDVELLIDGKNTFASIFEGIDTATEYILVQFYIVHDDELGRALKDRLIARSKEGIRIFFLYDEIGSIGLPRSYLADLRAAGVEIFPFHSRKGRGNRFQLNFRNHRKIVVVDGRTAWIGGHNVGDEYVGKDPKIGHWRDTHVRIDGPATIGAQLSFAEDWHWATDKIPQGLVWSPQLKSAADKKALVIPSGPADELETASLMYTQAINAARQRIWIASPYFVPDDAVVQAIQLAGLRGVDVRILIPDETDSALVGLAAYSFLDQVAATGARFYRYQGGFLHQKVTLIDDQAVTIGTANFDNRSFRLNFEVTAVIVDLEIAADVEQMLEADFARSRLMTAGEYDSKPFWFRLAVRAARLAAPIL